MSELIKNEIGENQISEKIGEINWVEAKIKDSYKEIYETKNELSGLKSEIANNLSGEKLKGLIENELTINHVKQVLEQAVAKFSKAAPNVLGFKSVYNEMGAGLTFNLQLALAKLGAKFSQGIDGIYGSTDTTQRVKEFQNAWNVQHPDQALVPDGWAGKETIQKIITALGEANRDKSKLVAAPKATTTPRPAPLMPEKKTTNRTGLPENMVKTPEQQKPAQNQPQAKPTTPETAAIIPDTTIVFPKVPYSVWSGKVDFKWTDGKMYQYTKEDGTKGVVAQETLNNLLTQQAKPDLAKFIEDKAYKFEDIFTAEDMKNEGVQKFITWFVKDEGLKLDDARVTMENGKKYLRFDYDNRGYDHDWNHAKFSYDYIFPNGTFDEARFKGLIRKNVTTQIAPKLAA